MNSSVTERVRSESLERGNPSGFVPLDLRVVVLPDPVEERSAGGIIMPDQIKDQRKWAQTKATLIAVGDNAFREWGSAAKPKAGDRVIVAQYAGRTHKGADGKDYTVCNDEDILALLEDE